MTLDFLARKAYYMDHLAPVWNAMKPEERGTFYLTEECMGRAYDLLQDVKHTADYYEQGETAGDTGHNPILTCAYGDAVRAADFDGNRPVILMEHGVGLTFGKAAYANGVGQRVRMHFFPVPNQHTQNMTAPELKDKPHPVVGMPKLDRWAGYKSSRMPDKPTIGVAFHHGDHYSRPGGTGSAWEHFAMSSEFQTMTEQYKVLLHCHPMSLPALRTLYAKLKEDSPKIEIVDDFNEIMKRADLYINDCCVSPETPILCADLIWREAKFLKAGDRIIACDEEFRTPQKKRNGTPSSRENRRLRTAIVVDNGIKQLHCYEIRTTYGNMIVSDGHPWLVRKTHHYEYMTRWKKKPQKSKYENWDWQKTRDLKIGDRVAYLIKPWNNESSWETGYIAGILDGEGNLYARGNQRYGGNYMQLGISQKAGLVLDKIAEVLAKLGIAYRHEKFVGKGVHKISICGKLEMLRTLGICRPTRLLDKAIRERLWEGLQISRYSQDAEIIGINDLGLQEVATLSTSEKTFIANGFIAHNSSTAYEFLVTGKPVILLNAPWFSREEHYGLRFWEYTDIGPQVDDPNTLLPTIEAVIQNPGSHAKYRARAVEDLFPYLGRSAQKTVQVIDEFLHVKYPLIRRGANG